jgi:hypothetical protein
MNRLRRILADVTTEPAPTSDRNPRGDGDASRTNRVPGGAPHERRRALGGRDHHVFEGAGRAGANVAVTSSVGDKWWALARQAGAEPANAGPRSRR